MKMRQSLWLLWVVLINACAPVSVDLSRDTPAIREIYRSLQPGPDREPMTHSLPVESVADDEFSQSVVRQLQQDFQRLPNPLLTLYVYPHLSAQGSPVPGYATQFNLFERTPFVRTRP